MQKVYNGTNVLAEQQGKFHQQENLYCLVCGTVYAKKRIPKANQVKTNNANANSIMRKKAPLKAFHPQNLGGYKVTTR